METAMKIEPQGSWYVVVPVEPSGRQASGLFLPDVVKQGKTLSIGVVRAKGPGDELLDKPGTFTRMRAEIGDVLHYASASTGGIVDGDGSPLVFVQDENIICIFRGITPETMRMAPGGKVALPTPSELHIVNGHR